MIGVQTQAGYAVGAMILFGLIGAGVACLILDRTKKFILIMRCLFVAGACMASAVCFYHISFFHLHFPILSVAFSS